MTESPTIDVSNFSKTYGSHRAVQDLSFAVQPGQILGLVGQNGAGKTTTLRTLAGIIRPDRGRLIVAGHDIVADPIAAKARLGYIPDDPRLFETLTVWEHLEFVAATYRVTDLATKAERLLSAFELQDKRDAVTHALSRGMRQKVGIMCAYLHDPKVLLFDEPLTGLDPGGIRAIRESIHQRARDGAAIVVSSHLLGLVEDLCTHVLILHEGQLRRFGALQEVLADIRSGGDDRTLEQLYFEITGHQQQTWN